MIEFRNLTKVFHLRGQRKVVADNISVVFPTGRAVGLLGRNGAGKSTLLKMIAGTMDPTGGHISYDGSISWPVGFAGSFHGELTGAQNARFIARIYGVDTDELVAFVRDFAGLGPHFDLPEANRRNLARAGVQSIEQSGLCTACRTDLFFSHRAENGKTGRFGTILILGDL